MPAWAGQVMAEAAAQAQVNGVNGQNSALPFGGPWTRFVGLDGALAATRVAFATADIRRALAELTQRRQLDVARPLDGGRPPKGKFKSVRVAAGRTSCIISKDDLCLPLAQSSFCPTLKTNNGCGVGERRAREQQQQQQLLQPDARRKPKVFHLRRAGRLGAGPVAGVACVEQLGGRQELSWAQGEGEWAKCSACSVSMNHLNEIKASAASICCPSLRTRGSYGLSDVSARNSGGGGDKIHEQRLRWFSRGAGKQIRANNPGGRGGGFGEKFVLRRSSFDLERREEARGDERIPEKRVARSSQSGRAGEPGKEVGFGEAAAAMEAMTITTAPSSNQPLGVAAPAMLDVQEALSPGPDGVELAKAHSASSGLNGALNGNLGKLVGKKAARLKQLVLQNLGRAERTQDELFEVYEQNFYKQQQQVGKLAKEFKCYLGALKHFQEASRSLNKCIQHSTSDYQSARHDLVCETLTQLEALNEDLMSKLHEQVAKQVGEYLSEFGEMKAKISKRHRKLIDYDKSRRLYEQLLAQSQKRRARQSQTLAAEGAAAPGGGGHSENYHSILRGLKFLSQQQQQHQQQAGLGANQQDLMVSQLVDEARLLKFREQFNLSKLMYESINSELHEELPLVYDKKMRSLLTALQSYFALEAHYHANASKLVGTVSEVIDEMPDCSRRSAALVAQRKMAASAASGTEGGRHATIVGEGADDDDEDDEDDDDDDDDSYESSGSSSAGSSGAGVAGRAGDGLAGDKSASARPAHAGSSGLGSSRGDSSCSVGSSSPDCPLGQLTAPEPEGEQLAEETGGSGKGRKAADCSTGAAAAGQPMADTSKSAGSEASVERNEEVAALDPVEGIVCVPDERAAGKLIAPAEVVADQARAGFLYKVKTNFKYLAEDVDELCFEPDEIIQVIEFSENQEPEEGWLLGVREINGQRGLFPANFTQPI